MYPWFLEKDASGTLERAVDDFHERALLQERIRHVFEAGYDDRPHGVYLASGTG